jgi:hypothetical protein
MDGMDGKSSSLSIHLIRPASGSPWPSPKPELETLKPKPEKPQPCPGEPHPSQTACPQAAEALLRGWNGWKGWKVKLTLHPHKEIPFGKCCGRSTAANRWAETFRIALLHFASTTENYSAASSGPFGASGGISFASSVLFLVWGASL